MALFVFIKIQVSLHANVGTPDKPNNAQRYCRMDANRDLQVMLKRKKLVQAINHRLHNGQPTHNF
jgi:hypothetical protein